MEDQAQTKVEKDRRSFLNILLGLVLLVGLGGTINTVLQYLWPTKEIIGGGGSGGPTTIPLNEIPVGGSKTVRHHGKPYVVVRQPTGIYAISAVCTHLGCVVYWDKEKKQLACPCHTAFFALNGAVIQGPPPSPLPVAQVKIVGEQIIIS
jgi:cytochrome b6-f complex iron-sulfur subunit